MASLQDSLPAPALTPSVNLEPKLASIHEELSLANETIGKLRTEAKTGRKRTSYKQQQAGAEYFLGVDKRIEAESGHRFEAPTWKNRVEDLELKLSTSFEVEVQTREGKK